MAITITRRPVKKLISTVVAMLLGGVNTAAMASAFQLLEVNGTNAGNYGAGVAAEAADASISYFNPAGLVYIQHDQVVGSANVIIASAKFSGTDTWDTFPTHPAFNFTESDNNIQGGGTFFIPAAYYAHPISENLVFGISANSPFGLETDWDDNSAVRYANTDTSLKVYDISPALGGRITDKLSIGAGIDFDYSTVEFDAFAGIPGLTPNNPTGHDAESVNKGSAFGVGAHAGLIFQFSPETRVGVNYASQVKMHYTGDSTTGAAIYSSGEPFTSGSLYSDVTLPATTTASFYHVLNPRWALLGTAMYTEWSSIKDIVLYNVSGAVPGLGGGIVPELIVVDSPQNYRDTWRVALGANFRATEKFMLRFGAGYDQNPTNDVDRNLRLPDGDRIGLSVGGHYQATQAVGFDLGYTHLFVKDGNINNTAVIGTQQATVVGNSENDGDIIGAQVTWNIT